MKSMKTSSLFRLAALLIIAVIVICMVGFAADRNDGKDTRPEDNSGEVVDGINPPPEDNNTAKPPEYTHYLTGLEITADAQKTKPLCFVLDSSSPLYGISGSPLTVEIPIENGTSRFLLYQDDPKNLGKIGSITSSRECITRLVDFFGGIAVYKGNDGLRQTDAKESGRFTFDLAATSGYAYTENTSFLYSNGDLLLAGLQNAGVSTAATAQTSPFSFAPYFSDPISHATSAQTVLIPYAANNETGLYYDTATGMYLLGKGGQVKSDLLNGKNAAYTNAFVLFANATTYESESYTVMTPDTIGGGKGYYFTQGTALPIEWSTDATGNLLLKNESGTALTVNRGASYIAFYKASQAASVIFS